MNDTRRVPSVPVELLKLRSATNAFLQILSDVEVWAEQAADVAALRDPGYRSLLDEILAAQRLFPRLNGTPAAIARICAELLGEEAS